MRKILCITLILLISLTAIFTFSYAEENNTNTENTANTNASSDLQTQRNELKNQLDEANGQLSNVQSNLSENLQQVEKLDDKIETAQTELSQQESKITELKDSISEVEKNLDDVTEQYDKQVTLFKKRMVATYEAGETRYIDVLLNSTSLADFLSSYYLIDEVTDIDEEMINELSKQKKQIDLSKQKLENEKDELATTIENQTRTAKTLENTKKMRETFIAKLTDDEKNLQAKIDTINTQYSEVNRQIMAVAQDLQAQGLSAEYVGGTFAWPVPGYTRITSNYAMRYHPITGQYKLHTGVDIGAPLGANFVAANDGTVVMIKHAGEPSGYSAYGNMVMIDHGGGVSTLYAHGSEILVELGQQVKRGDPVLKVGSTGYSTGPHAHFEVRINGVPTNPLPYITRGAVPGQDTENENTTNTENTTEDTNVAGNSMD